MLDASKRSSDSGLLATFGGEMCVGSYAAGLGAPEVGWEGRFIPALCQYYVNNILQRLSFQRKVMRLV